MQIQEAGREGEFGADEVGGDALRAGLAAEGGDVGAEDLDIPTRLSLLGRLRGVIVEGEVVEEGVPVAPGLGGVGLVFEDEGVDAVRRGVGEGLAGEIRHGLPAEEGRGGGSGGGRRAAGGGGERDREERAGGGSHHRNRKETTE
jgi:hypothetical protein